MSDSICNNNSEPEPEPRASHVMFRGNKLKKNFFLNKLLSIILHYHRYCIVILHMYTYAKFQLNREVSQNKFARFHDRQTSEVK